MKYSKTILKASVVVSCLLLGSQALASNSDTNTNGIFETQNITPAGTVTGFDGSAFGGNSDKWAFTLFGAGAQGNTRQMQVQGLNAGEDLTYSWTHTSGANVISLYNNFAPGWEWDPQLDALINAPTSNEAYDPTVSINGLAIAANTKYVLSGISNGDVINITMSYSGTENNLSSVIHGIVGTEVAAVPVPAAAWLFGSAMLGLAGIGRNRKQA